MQRMTPIPKGSTNFKVIGFVVFLIGMVVVVYGLRMDVTVETDSGVLINNIGLMADRSITLTIGAILAVVGFVTTMLGYVVRGGGKSL